MQTVLGTPAPSWCHVRSPLSTTRMEGMAFSAPARWTQRRHDLLTSVACAYVVHFAEQLSVVDDITGHFDPAVG